MDDSQFFLPCPQLGPCLGKLEPPGVLLVPRPTGSWPATLTSPQGRRPAACTHLHPSVCFETGTHVLTFTGASRDGSRGEDLSRGAQVTECAGWDGRGSAETEPLPPPQFSNGPWSAFASASVPWVRTLALRSSTSSKAPQTGPLPISLLARPTWPC